MERFRNLIGKIPTGVLSGLTVALILWLTLAPHPAGDIDLPMFPGADKIVHVIMFGFLTFIVLLEFMRHGGWAPLSLTLVGTVSLACGAFGIGIEFAQRAMGLGRGLEILDMLADSAGAIGMGGVWAAVQDSFAKH